MQDEVIMLVDGSRASKGLTETLWSILNMMAGTLKGHQCLYDLYQIMQNPSYKVGKNNKAQLVDMVILGTDGRIPAGVHQILQIALKFEGNDVILTKPYN